MSRPITISIPKPCHENWQDMTATERGAFCKSCQKEVIDFTKKTEDETHRILSAGGATCGRFRTDQLERPIHQTTYIKSWWHWKAIAASIISLIGYEESKANTPLTYSLNKDTLTRNNDLTVALSGYVVDSNNIPITNACVDLKSATNNLLGRAYSTDAGYFSFPKSINPLADKPSYFYIVHPRFNGRNFTIDSNNHYILKIDYPLVFAPKIDTAYNPVRMHEEEVGCILVSKRSTQRNRIRRFFHRIFHKHY